MTDPNQPDSRKNRLAAQLRANLHKRKAQAREMAQNDITSDSTLSKAPPNG